MPVALASRTLKWAVVVAIAVAVVVAAFAGAFDALRDQDAVEEFLTDSGPWGPLAYVFAFLALQPLSLPGALLIIPATFVWPWWEVATYTLAGGMLASTAGFILARWLAQDWVEARLPARLRPWEQRLADHGFLATVGLRLVTGYAPAADWFLGVSRISFTTFLAGTFVGLIPGTLALSVWGDDAARGIVDAPIAALVIVGLLVVVGVWISRRRAITLDSDEPD
ncbi:MAG: TVP38/TMEM64 family protein [Acidimicrobiales bacterium]